MFGLVTVVAIDLIYSGQFAFPLRLVYKGDDAERVRSEKNQSSVVNSGVD